MIHVQESSAIQSTAFTRLHQAGKTLSAILRNSVKARPGLWLGIAGLAVLAVACAVVKLIMVSGGSFVLALLRDAGHQVGGGGLLGALGALGAGVYNLYTRDPDLETHVFNGVCPSYPLPPGAHPDSFHGGGGAPNDPL